jgi:hypothetical protein
MTARCASEAVVTPDAAAREIILPSVREGWGSQYYANWDCSVIEAPNKQGLVTIDWKRRGYRLGMVFLGPLEASGYSGRGWMKRLVDDAQTRLAEAIGR